MSNITISPQPGPSATPERNSPGPSALETTVGILTAVLTLAAIAVALVQIITQEPRKRDEQTQNPWTPSNYRGFQAHNNSPPKSPLIRRLQLYLEGILRNIPLIENRF
jgi:hypothetical protein